MAIIALDDPDDSRVADYRNIPDPELIARRGIFVAEGRLVVGRLLTDGRVVARSVMVTAAALNALRPLIARHPDLPVFVVTQRVMSGIAGFNIHRGCLAIGERPARRSWQEVSRDARRLVVLERIGDADNVGSVFRSAAAFGVGAVLLDPACTDPLYRKAIRTSMGAALLVPFARIDEWPRALSDLARTGVAVIALTPSSSATCVRDVAQRLSDQRIAVVLGHEGGGLTEGALAACTHHARIPIASGVDSINVAVAAAIALYEIAG